MRKIQTSRRIFWLLLAAVVPCFTVFGTDNTGRVRENFDLGWRFLQGDVTNAEQVTCADRDWTKVNVPHDWSIAGPYDKTNSIDARGGFLPTGIGWYRKHFLAPESLRSRRITVEFDGVYQTNQRNAFGGLALAMVQSGLEPGELHVTTTSENLKSATVKWSIGKSDGQQKPLFPALATLEKN
jgi:hypothetical protein